MNYFIDTEFQECPVDCGYPSIDIISIGIVSGDGREFYMINRDFRFIGTNVWVVDNVLKIMPEFKIKESRFGTCVGSFEKDCEYIQPRDVIAYKIKEFVKEEYPVFWGYYADYDWVVFCWLFGTMMDLPPTYPMYCRDIRQVADLLGNPKLPPQENEHNALEDAKWNKKAFEYLERKMNG